MTPFFIKSSAGNIFCLYHTPPNHATVKRNILFIPPFAEELNRSRHMINRQARLFCQAGYGVLILDLFGTGDSQGSFGEATLPIWKQDILAAISWLAETSDTPPIIWAMRSGALIATDIIGEYPELTDQMILWSPVRSGKKFITQYMRIKLASEVTRKTNNQKTTINDLWKILESGNGLEIAGYYLSPVLAKGLSKLSLNNSKLPKTLAVKWIETGLGDPAHLSPASQKIIDCWLKDGITVTDIAVNDVAFWALQEPEQADTYIEQTMALIAK